MEKITTSEDFTPEDLITQEAAREFYLSSIDETRAGRREYDRLAFLALAFMFAKPSSALIAERIGAARDYAHDQYLQANQQPFLEKGDFANWLNIERIIGKSFHIKGDTAVMDPLERARIILNRDPKRVWLDTNHPQPRSDDAA